MRKIILTVGLPGCGKTTWMLEQLDKFPGKYKNVCKDDLRWMIDGGKWSLQNEKSINKLQDHVILESLKAGFDVIVSDTNLNPKTQDHIRQLVDGLAKVEVKDFTDVPIDVCVARDKSRMGTRGYVGYKVIHGMWFKFLAPAKKAVEFQPKLPFAIICDLDGTLALFEGKRSPYDASDCLNDDLNGPVADIVRTYSEKGYQIIFVSGRKDKYKEPTEQFLKKHGFNNYLLYMRKSYLEDGVTENNVKDWVIKTEIYDQFIKDKFNVMFCLDDRDQVVQLCWRVLGLTCFQVAEGSF